MVTQVIITTYDRPLMLEKLLYDIKREMRAGHALALSVYDDGTPEERRLCKCSFPEGTRLVYRGYNGGKKEYWALITQAFGEAYRSGGWDRLVMLPDDVRIEKGFFAECERVWQAIDDPLKIALNPLLDKQRIGKPCWTGIPPITRRYGSVEVYRTGWNDLCFYAERRFLHALHGRVYPVPTSRWKANPDLSSGVGAQISRRLVSRGYTFYQVTQSLVSHGSHASKLNPSERKRTPLTS